MGLLTNNDVKYLLTTLDNHHSKATGEKLVGYLINNVESVMPLCATFTALLQHSRVDGFKIPFNSFVTYLLCEMVSVSGNFTVTVMSDVTISHGGHVGQTPTAGAECKVFYFFLLFPFSLVEKYQYGTVAASTRLGPSV